MTRLLLIAAFFLGGLISSARPAEGGDLTLPFLDQVDYNVTSWLDHTSPLFTGDTNPVMTRYDGQTGFSYNGHSGVDFPLLYETVIAAAKGSVTEATVNNCLGNYIRIYHTELGYSTVYAHLDSLTVTSGTVQRGQQIGVSGFTGDEPDCIDGPHLHFAARNGQTGTDNLDPYGWSGTGNDPWAPGQAYGQMFAIRVGVLSGGQVSVKEGTLAAGWSQQSSPVASFSVSGQRIGSINTGTAYVKDGELGSGWTTQYAGASTVALSGRRIGVISTTNSSAYVKEGDLNQAWYLQGNGVNELAITHGELGVPNPSRVGVRLGNLFLVKQGSIAGSGWTTVATNAKAIALGAGWIGCIDTSNNAWVKQGLNDAWTLEASNVSFLSLGGAGANRRIAVVQGGVAKAKEGGLSAGWVTLWTGATKVRVNSARAAILATSGDVRANEGSLSAAMSLQASGVADLRLN